VLATSDTREALLDALPKRHIYASTDNVIAAVRSGSHIMGDVFLTDKAPEISGKLVGTSPFAKVVIVKDNPYVYTTQPGTKVVEFRWRDYGGMRDFTPYAVDPANAGRLCPDVFY
jgi:hypothetical protein